ncbi:serine/threonine-protein kinase [Actinoallomurus rhizosphaericola]|uniref:serine/threonine-protein kinase n=1 Tax=Actinoallomurus rhizosphaericola TaxID=2952536 RepID=UPI002092A4CD|nr:serine/threonine-protein kinase [Actinoallomurus rhizosphaericola]MCO5995571.1 serine/threonine protein kinase [Actinoallomurus rhizosphaericola]
MASGRTRLEPLSRHDPRRIGGYALLGRLGSGAMGRVYLGRSASGRLVAVKTIRSEFAGDADFRSRFAREVAAAGRVSGVFTAAVVAADPEAEIPWLATAYIPAPSLEQLVRTCGPLPVPALRWLAAGCAEALESIHQAGLVHRDLKPSNVLVSIEGPRVIDFGVARATERVTATATHQAVGTPAYMAPEQARDSRQTTPASDVFALGSTLLFAATGHPPYTGKSVTDVLLRLASDPPDLTGMPDEAADLLLDCLRRDPADRPAAGALLARLAVELDGSGAAPLPFEALSLLEEYRREPPPVESPADDRAAEDTLDSPTSVRAPDGPPPAGRPDGSGDSDPRRPGRSGGSESRQDRSGVLASRRTVASRRVGRGGRVLAALLGAGVALLIGVGLGRMDDDDRPRQPAGPPPPGAAPPGAPGVAPTARPSGRPRITLNQPYGDGRTGFVVHGAGLTPGRPVGIRLDRKRVAAVTPVVDFAGTFNYVINQSHEFFPGKIPPGRHRVTVTVPGVDRPLELEFTVNDL